MDWSQIAKNAVEALIFAIGAGFTAYETAHDYNTAISVCIAAFLGKLLPANVIGKVSGTPTPTPPAK